MFQPDSSYRPPPGSPHYYPVSIQKVLLLSFASFGVYQIGWHYRNWWAVRLRTGARVSPIWRSLLFWLFSYSLFRRIRASADEHQLVTGFSPGFAAGATALFALFWRLDETFWFTTILTVIPLVMTQRVVNRLNEVVAPAVAMDDGLTGWQKFSVPLGSLGFILAVVGTVVVAY